MVFLATSCFQFVIELFMFRFNSLIVTSPGGSVLNPELIKHLNKLRLKVKLINSDFKN